MKLQRKQSYTSFRTRNSAVIDSNNRSGFNFVGEHFNCADNSFTDCIRNKEFSSCLYDTWFFTMSNKKNISKIKIICKNNEIIILCMTKDFGIGIVRRANR